MFYSQSTGGFYDPAIHGENIPVDAVEISGLLHQTLLQGQATGQVIVANEAGYPVLAERPLPPLADSVAQAMRAIDLETDRITYDTIGSRGEEYRQAEIDAQAFKDAGYVGTVPPFVADYVAAKGGWTAQQAADDILATATAWRGALGQIRANRLRCKELARTAASHAALDDVLAQWAGFVITIRAALGLQAA